MRIRKSFEYLLLPFSLIYGGIIYFRNLLFDLGILEENEFNLPVISVGNLTVGGTGKTPHVEYLLELLKDNYHIAVLSRGYKRKTRGFLLAEENTLASEIGDEPCQIKRKYSEITVAVDEKRSRGIKKIMEIKPQIDLIILDDAFQHRYVKPGLSILLIDYNRPVWNDFLLPLGRLREPVSSAKRAKIILISKSPDKLKDIDRRIITKKIKMDSLQHLFYTRMKAGMLKPVFKGSSVPEYKHSKENKPEILLVTGIANPRSVKRFIRSVSTKITEMHFPDHHEYSVKTIQKIVENFEKLDPEKRILITTEKDAAKMLDNEHLFGKIVNQMFYIPVQVDFLNNDAKNFEKQILNYVRDNKRNSVLHKKRNRA